MLSSANSFLGDQKLYSLKSNGNIIINGRIGYVAQNHWL